MSVTQFNLEHKIKPRVNAKNPPCMYKSLKHNLNSCLKSVWGGTTYSRKETDQLWYDKYQPLPLFSQFCSMLPRHSEKQQCPGALCDVCGTGCKFTQTKILGKKIPPLLLCYDLTLRSCVPSVKDSTRAVLNPSASFYMSPAGALFEGFCLLWLGGICADPVHTLASPGSPGTMLKMFRFCFQTWEATKSPMAARGHHSSQALHQRLCRSLNVQR